jgi:transcriptional regulator
MYIPNSFKVTDKEKLITFISQWSFGDLITSHNGRLNVSHVPFLIDEQEMVLYGHLARQNPHSQNIEAAEDLMVLFKGPHAYVSPRWYVQKDMVPTWNFQSVKVKGRAHNVDEVTLITILDRLSQKHEANYENPWRIDEISEKSMKAMLGQIIGFKIPIDEIVGKYKLSQNRNIDIQTKVIDGLLSGGSDMERQVALKMQQNIVSRAEI